MFKVYLIFKSGNGFNKYESAHTDMFPIFILQTIYQITKNFVNKELVSICCHENNSRYVWIVRCPHCVERLS